MTDKVTQTMAEETPRPQIHGGTLAANIGRNTFFGVVARIAQVGTRLVTVPIVIAHLGLGGYGIWSILMTTAAYMRFGSIGVKSAFQKYVAEATGSGNFEAANRLLSTGCAIMAVISVAGLVPIAIFSRELAKVAGVPSQFLVSSAHSFTVLAVIMVLSNVGAVYEAIVMGGHRIDLARNLTTFYTVAEAVAIVILLYLGFGLFAMASVMAASEVCFVASCYVVSRKIVPQIRVSLEHVTKRVIGELLRFAGSYQVANVMQVLYMSIVPVTLLRIFGADAAGIYALTIRLVQSAMMLPDSLLSPILSSASMVFAGSSASDMRTLINKSFKVTLVLGFFPLVFTALFGPLIVFAWTGEASPSLRIAFWLVCAAGLFQSFSTLGLVLYRASGRVLLDNIRLASQIVLLLLIAIAAPRLGFHGVLVGLASVEFLGMIFMMYALTHAFEVFRLKALLADTLRMSGAIAIVLVVAGATFLIPLPAVGRERVTAMIRLAEVCIACLIAAWPALVVTKSLTPTESKALLSIARRPLSAESS
jgi:O-antigen/teichoic acid export membrane protein